MPDFVGTYERKIDHRRRVVIPLDYRRGNNNWLLSIGRIGELNYISMFPEETYDRFKDSIEPYMLYRVPVDEQGRILIPQELSEYIGHEVVFVGNDDTVQIWNENNWNNYLNKERSTALRL